jgi:putative SOS response-associated peptidase YedK
LALLQSGFDYQNWMVVTGDTNQKDIKLENMHWEFIPTWIKNSAQLYEARKEGIPWLNATAEKMLDSKMFQHAARNNRCLVPITHFIEWRHFKPAGTKKSIAYPYCIKLKGQEIFYLAGIYQPWTDQYTGETFSTFAIVTRTANSLMESIHNTKKRMPLILSEVMAWSWIMDSLNDIDIKEITAFSIDAEAMEAYSILKQFKQADEPLNPIVYPELPLPGKGDTAPDLFSGFGL